MYFVAEYANSSFQLGIGEVKLVSSTPEQIFSAIFGAGSVFQKLRTAPLVRSICSLSIGFQLGSSRVLKSTVSAFYVLLRSGHIRPLTCMMNRICSSIRLFGEVGSKWEGGTRWGDLNVAGGHHVESPSKVLLVVGKFPITIRHPGVSLILYIVFRCEVNTLNPFEAR